MTRFSCVIICICVAAGALISAVCLAETPTVEEVLRICRENREKLNPLHVQATHIEERTDAYAKSQQQQVSGIEAMLKLLENGELSSKIGELPAGVTAAQFKQLLSQEAEGARALAKSWRYEQRYEFFVRGDDYQVRSALDPVEKNWDFPNAPLTADTFPKEYARFRIYSRSASQPPAKIWPGLLTPDSEAYAMITTKHVREGQSMQLPMFMQTLHADILSMHPIDVFLSAPADRYKIVGQETKDGRVLTIIDVLVPTELKGGKTDPDGKPQQYNIAYWYRAWLDLDRGGIPIVLQFWYGGEGVAFDEHFRATPSCVTKTTEIKKLSSGGYFPTHSITESFNSDPDAPQLSQSQWDEVRAGTRKPPPNVVFERSTWDCTQLDTAVPNAGDFFLLKFPPGQKYFDLDTGKVVGALEDTPPVKAGEQAPAWKVARWLDGKQHSLNEFHGKVVVLDFWGLWCSAFRNSVPALVTVQDKFKDQPVVFISVHTAESDTEKVATRIEKFAAEQGWQYLAAIDSGSMTENSATSHAYGCTSFPTEVIIGPDGHVAYNSAVPEPGMEEIVGKHCDQITPEDQVKIDAFEKKQFEAAGEKWPLPDGLSKEEFAAVANRLQVFQLTRRISDALSAVEQQRK